MSVQNILIWPDPTLKKVAQPVTDFGDDLKSVVKDLTDSMDAFGPMAGLAAPQIGISKRVFIVDIPPEDNEGNGTNGREVFVNPEIYFKEGSFSWDEGCMSVPGLRGKVTRAYTVRMRYQNEQGEQLDREAFYYLGGCFQHELDHLNGVLWVDYQNPLKKNMIKKKMLKLKELPIEEQQKWREET
jgi:peptide deformylase